MKNQFIYPGFHDGHIHVQHMGRGLLSLDCSCDSIAELRARLQEYVQQNPEKDIILGHSWDHELLGKYPSRKDIDDITTKPVVLMHVGHHACLVNSNVLREQNMMEMNDPPGGKIDRFDDTERQPTGILRETAMAGVKDVYVASLDASRSFLKAGLQECVKNGITSVQSNDYYNAWPAYKELVDANELPIRVFFTLPIAEMNNESSPKAKEKYGRLLSCDRIKIVCDGALGVSTAALSEPYLPEDACGCPHNENKGLLLHTPEELKALVRSAKENGFRVEAHVIGDRAAEVCLDALEYANITQDDRPVLTHCQVLRPHLMERMRNIGAIAAIQPQFVVSDFRWVQKRLGSDRLKSCYAWKTLKEKGIKLSGSSDAPVESPNPLQGIYASIYRRPYEQDSSFPSFQPDQCLSMKEALDLYTTGPAFAATQEARLGTLRRGWVADFVVMRRRLEDEIVGNHVTEVWVDGSRVHSSQSSAHQ